jgi:hypothetical protein
MPWYAAHAIMYVEFKDGAQNHYPVWENVLLIEAADGKEAHEKTYRRAKRDEAADPSFTWSGRPARWVFAGIRKLLTVSHESDFRQPDDGDEITYCQFDLPDRKSLDRLVACERVRLDYEVD